MEIFLEMDKEKNLNEEKNMEEEMDEEATEQPKVIDIVANLTTRCYLLSN